MAGIAVSARPDILSNFRAGMRFRLASYLLQIDTSVMQRNQTPQNRDYQPRQERGREQNG